MRHILNTLYVMTPHAYVHLENDTLRIEVEREKKLQVPLHHIGSVVCFGDVMISPGAMHRCANDHRCPQCSLREIRQPEALLTPGKLHRLRRKFFDPDAQL